MNNNEQELEIYEIAYMLCDKKVQAGDLSDIDNVILKSIEETINKFKDEVNSIEGLREYLNRRISQEREEEKPIILLGEEAENEEWWKEYRIENKNNLKFWNRYYKYLYDKKGWERSAIKKSIDNTTDILLNAISNPNLGVAMERRAMVVGYVQSGKTANYIGLINKALDAGYKYIIVLAGIHNNLRSQTQSRIDEEVLGYETDSKARQLQRERAEKNKIGVGNIANANYVQTLTFRDEKGDFSKARSKITTTPDIPTIIVTKKTKSTLENLIENIESNSQISKDEETNKFYMASKYPLLLIDDEADQASVNTKYAYDDQGNIKDEYDATTINILVRKLLDHFKCRSYVGYTATPYANIFIPNDIGNLTPKSSIGELGNDLFPADCIISLPKPHRYIGANEYFGSNTNEVDDEGNGEIDTMPLTRKILEENFVDVKNKKVGELPKSLKKAILTFIMAIATRNCRGEKCKPNTMLIHVARIKNMHSSIERKVKEYYDILQSMIIDGDTKILFELKQLWESDFVPTTQKMMQDFEKYMNGVELIEYKSVINEIKRLMNEELIKIHMINGDSKDTLCYKENEGKEYNVIAIGGDKFSRGLTLEGLSVSYFTRESKYYDSLMQMGRWFGFRHKYADLCRIFITDTVYNWFARVAFATDNLRGQISYMCDVNAKPKDFGLRVATHPILMISNPNKVKSGFEQKLDFGNTLTITRDIDVDIKQYQDNFDAIERLLLRAGNKVDSNEHFEKLGRNGTDNSHYFWENVPGRLVVDFFEEYKTSKYANKVNGHNISEYIKEQMKDNYLINWTICMINSGERKNGFRIAGVDVNGGITRRKEGINLDEERMYCSVQMLKSKGHEYFDFDKDKYKKALDMEKQDEKGNEKYKSSYIRAELRKDKENALLLIYPIDHKKKESSTSLFNIEGTEHKNPFGLAVVFPPGNGKSISYVLNSIAAKGEEEDVLE
ncbi:hypothetical protein D2A34_19145 [Clostridium chromiireducens]|uniref:Putative endonuclease Z1 domain-containing protein n=1 Tax=Clostridium chromiireducens TaxID=225345 RepID=A0A399IIW9_9CLOT|nr:Z1 domain-containing protein [Clostridium chromiireducens]RII32954.1 hypothetical protein D2A34_19145 [Clostridium chromiireducens]